MKNECITEVLINVLFTPSECGHEGHEVHEVHVLCVVFPTPLLYLKSSTCIFKFG